MTQHIGIVAGSAEGAALCYRTICSYASSLMGEHNHPEVTMNSVSLAEHMRYVRLDDWQAVAELLLQSAKKIWRAGADFAICPVNTYHRAFKYLTPRSPIPWIDIRQTVAVESNRLGHNRVGILGSKYLMEGFVYREALGEFRIKMEIPDEEDRLKINDIIFDELVKGILLEKSRQHIYDVMTQLKSRGCDAVVLACSELPLIVQPDVSPLPTLDSTRLLARAAVRRAVGSH